MCPNAQEHRELLFDIYSKNLSEVEPGTTDTFRCPICLKDFDKSALAVDQALTLGHIIPKNAGGHMTTLECGGCNSKIGSKYESHVANMREAIAWAQREVGTERLVRFRANDKSSAATISYEEGPTAVIKATNGADPNYQAVTEEFEAHAANPSELEMGYSFDTRSALNNRILSAVHAAFLMMFYCFGYEYILSPEASFVRKIINEGMAPWPLNYMESRIRNVPEMHAPSVGVIRKPENIKSLAAFLPCFYDERYVQVIVLPGLDGMATYTNYINSRRAQTEKTKRDFEANIINNGPTPKGFYRWFWNRQ